MTNNIDDNRAEFGEGGLDFGAAAEAGAAGAGVLRIGIGEGLEVGFLGGVAGEKAADEFLVAGGEFHTGRD